MKKRSIISLAGSIGLGVVFSNMIKRKIYKGKTKLRHDGIDEIPQDEVILDEAGIPDQIDGYDEDTLMENAEMVDEGSLFGVNYYNEVKNEEAQ